MDLYWIEHPKISCRALVEGLADGVTFRMIGQMYNVHEGTLQLMMQRMRDHFLIPHKCSHHIAAELLRKKGFQLEK